MAVNVGAAPTPVEVLEFFHAIGIPIGELWGMSETCGVATCNPPGKVKLGTVGPPMPGIEIKLADDGEVLVKGASNMLGYRNMPDKTAETIDEDGWLAHRRHRRARRGRLPEDRRPQEGADHQRGRQEHVAGQHRGDAEGREPADRPGGRDRRRAALQRRADHPRPRLRARAGRRSRGSATTRSRTWPRTRRSTQRSRRPSTRRTTSSRASSRSRSSSSCRPTGSRAATS